MKIISKSTCLFAIIISITSCKKQYTCECKNSGDVIATYNLNETNAKAKSICDKHNAEINSIPWSESWCELK